MIQLPDEWTPVESPHPDCQCWVKNYDIEYVEYWHDDGAIYYSGNSSLVKRERVAAERDTVRMIRAIVKGEKGE
jgi:hypothetical protein